MFRRLMRMLVPVLVIGGLAAPIILSTQAGATTAIATSITVTPVKSSITYGAEVSPNERFDTVLTAGTTQPTGTVTVTWAGNPVCTTDKILSGGATTVNWRADCSPTSNTILPAGNDSIGATYSGDLPLYTPTYVDTALPVVAVQPAPVTVNLSLPSSVFLGSESGITLSATASSIPGAGTPTGTMTFFNVLDPSSALCTVALDALGNAQCSPFSASSLSPGSYSFQATFNGIPNNNGSGEANFASQTSGPQGLTVVQPKATITLSLSPVTTTYGQENQVNLSAAVAGPNYGNPPTPFGHVTFYAKATNASATTLPKQLCEIGLVNGSATCPLSATELPAAANNTATQSYDIYATYGGDADYASVTTAPQTLWVRPATVVITSLPTPTTTTYGQENGTTIPITVTSEYGGSAPAGTVAVWDGKQLICDPTLVNTGAGATSATPETPCTISGNTLLPAGSGTLTFDYTPSSGDTVNPAATATGSIVVKGAPTSTTLTVSQGAVEYGNESKVQLKATVTGVYGSLQGTVTFKTTSGDTICSDVSETTGSATCDLQPTSLGIGGWNLVAVYSPASGSNDATSTSSEQPLSVTPAGPTVQLEVSKAFTYSVETAGSFQVTVDGSSSVGTRPTGSVAVYAGSTTTPLCTGVFLSSTPITTTWTCTPTSDTALDAGGYQAVAQYTPNSASNYKANASTAYPFTVSRAPTQTRLASASATGTYGAEASVTFHVKVDNTVNAAVAPTGSVAVDQGGTTLCTASLSAGSTSSTGTCTLTATQLPAGTYSNLEAVYTPSTSPQDFEASNSGSTFKGSVTISSETTYVKVAASSSSVTYGNESSVTLSATVTSQYGQTPNGGTIAFVDGASTPLCTSGTVTNGVASCTLGQTTLPVKGSPPSAYEINGSYSGAQDFAPLASATTTGTLTVTPDATSTTLSFSPQSSVALGAESSELFRATVTNLNSSVTPTGTVAIWATLRSGATVQVCTISSSMLKPAGQSASGTCWTTKRNLLPVGSYSANVLWAAYTPGSLNLSKSSSWLSAKSQPLPAIFTVTPAPTTVGVTFPASVNYGNEHSATFDATVTSTAFAPSKGTITVTATASNNTSTTVCTLVGSSASSEFPGGTGYCMPSDALLGVGTYTITVSYKDNVDSNFQSSTFTSPKTFTVVPAGTSTRLVLSSDSLVYGQEHVNEEFKAVVTDTTGNTPPTGSVAITTGATTACTVSLTLTSANEAYGYCRPAATGINAGTYMPDGVPDVLSASYTPANGDFTSSSTSDLPSTPVLTVSAASASVKITPSTQSVIYGEEEGASFTASVTSSVGTPSGTVAIATTGNVPLCTVTLSGGQGTCSPKQADSTLLPVSTAAYAVTGSYSGSTNIGPATSAAVELSVTKGTTKTLVALGGAGDNPIYVGTEGVDVIDVSVLDTTGSLTPAGTVSLTATAVSGGAVTKALCSKLVLVNGAASCTLDPSELAAGTYDITAVYSGDAVLMGSTGNLTDSSGDPLTLGVDAVSPSIIPGPGSFSFSGSSPLFLPSALSIVQVAPTGASVATSVSGSFKGQLATTGQEGTVSFTVTGPSSALSVSPSGAITTTGTLSAGTYSVVGTDSDTTGNSGIWSFQLVVTSPTTVVTPSITKKIVLSPLVMVASHNLVVHGKKASLFTAAKLRCANAKCHGTTWITQRRNHVVNKNGTLSIVSKIVVLGKTNYTVAAGKTHKQRIVLNAAGRKLLGRAKRSLHPLRVVVHASVQGGHQSARTVKVV